MAREEEKLPIATTSGSIPSALCVAVMFPAGAPVFFSLHQTDPAFSLKERRRFARIVPHLLDRGYEVTGVTLVR